MSRPVLRRPTTRLVAAFLGAALIVSGCSGDDDDGAVDPVDDAADDGSSGQDGSGDTGGTDGDGSGGDGSGGDDSGGDTGESDGSADGSATSTTTTVPDADAEDPPGDDVPDDEGLGDPLVFIGTFSGAAEVPGPGDDGGDGRVEIESDVDENLCFDMVVTGLDADVTAAHVHDAPAGAAGGVVIDIGPPTEVDGDTDRWIDVCLATDDDVVTAMANDPDQFYVNVHTASFGDGAVRAQLQTGSIFDLELS